MAEGAAQGTENLTIRSYAPGDEEGILALFNEAFAEDDPNYKARTLEQWRWEFLDNPAGNQIVLAVEPGGRIVAQYACLPALCNLDGRSVRIGQGIDSVVHKDYRRALKREGAFLRAANYYFEHFGRPEVNAFGYGFPNSKALRLGVKLLHYEPIAAPVRTVARNLINFKDDDEVGRDAADGEDVIEVDRFGDEVDALWERLKPQLRMAIIRDAQYLNWRYVDCAVARYRAFALLGEDRSWRAVCVTRANWQGPPILGIVDWLSDNRDAPASARLLQHACRIARDTGQMRVELWIPPTHPLYDHVTQRGFAPEDSHFNLCIKIYEPSLTAAWARGHWYYTIGDSDVF